MDDKTKSKIILVVGFTLGIVLGAIYHENIANLFSRSPSEPLRTCPAADTILPHFKNAPIWTFDDLLWSISPTTQTIPEKISFYEADIGKSNKELMCFYQVPEAPDIILSINLNMPKKATVEMAGSSWKKVESGLSCKAHDPATCAFRLIKD